METAALIASCVSGLLAFVAIGLAITFYVMSNKISQDIIFLRNYRGEKRDL